MPWPRLSLTCLKSSRSRKSTDERLGGPVPAAQRVGQPVAEQLPVGQPGERVVERLVAQLLLERVPVGDVADGEHPGAARGRRPSGCSGCPRGPARGRRRAGCAASPAARPPGAGEHPHEHRYVAGDQQVDEAPADAGPRGRGRARTWRRRADEGRGGVGLEDGDQVGAVLHERQQPPLAGVEGLLLGEPRAAARGAAGPACGTRRPSRSRPAPAGRRGSAPRAGRPRRAGRRCRRPPAASCAAAPDGGRWRRALPPRRG